MLLATLTISWVVNLLGGLSFGARLLLNLNLPFSLLLARLIMNLI